MRPRSLLGRITRILLLSIALLFTVHRVSALPKQSCSTPSLVPDLDPVQLNTLLSTQQTQFVGRALPSTRLSLLFAFPMENVDQLESLMMRVSDPDSPNYGKFASVQDITSIVSPASSRDAQIQSLTTLLQSSGDVDFLQPLRTRDGLMVTAPVSTMEKLFSNMIIYEYRWIGGYASDPSVPKTPIPYYSIQSNSSVGCPILPAEVAKFVEFVYGFSYFGPPGTSETNYFGKPWWSNEFSPAAFRDSSSLGPVFRRRQNHEDSFPFGRIQAPPTSSYVVAARPSSSQVSVQVGIVCPNQKPATSSSSPCQEYGYTLVKFTSFLRQANVFGEVNPLTGSDVAVDPNIFSSSVGFSSQFCGNVDQVITCFVPVPLPAFGVLSTLDSFSVIFRNASQTIIQQDALIMMKNPMFIPSAVLTPEVFRSVYHIPQGVRGISKDLSVSVLVAQLFQSQQVVMSDLQTYIDMFGLGVNANTTLDIIQEPPFRGVSGGEAMLDVSMIQGVTPDAPMTLWSNNTGYYFLLAKIVEDSEKTPAIISVSYGDAEQDAPEIFVRRTCLEALKLAALGKTVTFSTGDTGATLTSSVSPSSSCTSPLQAGFPASCPYVVAAGGTMLSGQATPFSVGSNSYTEKQRVAGFRYDSPLGLVPESQVVCSFRTGGRITGSGGFSSVFDAPSWQQPFTQRYMDLARRFNQLPSLSRFSSSGRGIPDISALASDFPIVISGARRGVAGTSASTPQISGMFVLMNQERMNSGLPPLGFPLPLFYKLASARPDSFYDVTVGDNRCTETECCDGPQSVDSGFSAMPGWDPTTGLGTPNVARLLRYILDPLVIPSFANRENPAVPSEPNDHTLELRIVAYTGLGCAVIALVIVLILAFRSCRRGQDEESMSFLSLNSNSLNRPYGSAKV